MNAQQFIAKWQRVQLSERSACQQHFLDICELLGQPKPAEADPEGTHYTFERGCHKMDGGDGWADVWMQGHFGWEYKGKRKNLKEAYQQLCQYREDLENPPLLVVCDLDRFEVHTNFTGTVKEVHAFNLAGLAEGGNLDVLRRLFADPESLKPGRTPADVTREAADRFAALADGLRERGVPAERAARFLMKLMFCMFGEDIGLLPEKLFTRTVQLTKGDPNKLRARLGELFRAMAAGGAFGADEIAHFNGGLFEDADVVPLEPPDVQVVMRAVEYDWANIEPSIFGTLFERLLDPDKRSQIGAHYTSREDIETLIEPVVMVPLRREWAAVKERCEELRAKFPKRDASKRGPVKESKERRQFAKALMEFIARLDSVKILDPACGSGNFLYVALNKLLDLEKEVITYGMAHQVSFLPQVRPTQLAGIEINPFAQELAQVVIWIGYLQWMHFNGFNPPSDPVLDPIESIERRDAILDLSDPEHPQEPAWPAADFIVGNPPFLGGKLLRTNLGDEYVDAVFGVWDERVPREADLCCYWFEKARAQIKAGKCGRAGLLATQGIRGGANRKVLERIKETGDIFWAESDRDWTLDGAAVHVSMVGFDTGEQSERVRDGQCVAEINADLTTQSDLADARALIENRAIGFMGVTKQGPFDLSFQEIAPWLRAPNPHGAPNSDIILPYLNGRDVTQRSRDSWLICFQPNSTEASASRYERPFQHAKSHVEPFRKKRARGWFRDQWWQLYASRPEMRKAMENKLRYLATPRVAKFRLFVWVTLPVVPDCQLIAFARDDDVSFGVLQSRIHELWGLRQGTRLETRPRYTPTTCFETFPFPDPTDAQRAAIAAAAKELDELRSRWLNPPEWTKEEVLEFPGSADGPWARYVHGADGRGIGTVRYPRTVAKDADCAQQLAKRTLTNLYNQRPAWLDLAHRRLDAAVFTAYGWPADLSDEEILARLLELNLERSGARRNDNDSEAR